MEIVRFIILMAVHANLFYCVIATNYSVGGDSGWDLSSNVQAWSSVNTFRVGDYLVFNYLPLHDVLEVNRNDFSICRTVNPISAHTDGQTVIHLEQPGSRYFICGRLRHCRMGLKVRVQVLQHSSNDNSSTDGRRGSRPLQPKHPSPPSSESELPPFPDTPEACNCTSGEGKLVGIDWWSLLLIMLSTHSCSPASIFHLLSW